MKRKHNDMTVVGKIDSYKNMINLLNQLGETSKSIWDDNFQKSSNQILLKDGHIYLMDVFRTLDNASETVSVSTSVQLKFPLL